MASLQRQLSLPSLTREAPKPALPLQRSAGSLASAPRLVPLEPLDANQSVSVPVSPAGLARTRRRHYGELQGASSTGLRTPANRSNLFGGSRPQSRSGHVSNNVSSNNVAEQGDNTNLEECAICFECLPDAPVAVLTRRGRRVCRHFFHEKCASALMEHRGTRSKTCPCCRAEFDGRVEVPSVEADAKAWFNLVDFDGDGALQQSELMEILRATLKIDVGRLERDLPLMFRRFDANSDGKIEFGEMMGPHGLFYHVRRMYRTSSSVKKFVPDIKRSKEAWFQYWDEDGSGSLSRVEIVRSIVKTFNLSSDFQQLQGLRGVVDALWPLFDTDGSGEIDMVEFCKPNEGLADVLILNLSLV